jgi:hypothetical protein
MTSMEDVLREKFTEADDLDKEVEHVEEGIYPGEESDQKEEVKEVVAEPVINTEVNVNETLESKVFTEIPVDFSEELVSYLSDTLERMKDSGELSIDIPDAYMVKLLPDGSVVLQAVKVPKGLIMRKTASKTSAPRHSYSSSIHVPNNTQTPPSQPSYASEDSSPGGGLVIAKPKTLDSQVSAVAQKPVKNLRKISLGPDGSLSVSKRGK